MKAFILAVSSTWYSLRLFGDEPSEAQEMMQFMLTGGATEACPKTAYCLVKKENIIDKT